MIISALLDLVRGFFNLVFAALSFVDVPSGVVTVLQQVLFWLQQGVEFVAAYTHFEYLNSLIAFVLAFDVFHTGYLMFMWVVKKIPMWGVKP